ncbi:MAG: hypothetical protein LBO66_09425 [Deltaproteobacteria bacterium]|jgi:hypothetical protein|nr:hypothetical protein [Deltaproteobacteria bacterium]
MVRAAFYMAVKASYIDPIMGIIKAEDPSTLTGQNNWGVETNSIPITASDLDPELFTPNPKISSVPSAVGPDSEPTGASATMVVEKYYYKDLMPNTDSFSEFFKFDSEIANPDASNTQGANNAKAWGTQMPNPAADKAVNGYGVVRKGDYYYISSYDNGRITRLNANNDALAGSADHGPKNGLAARAQGLILWDGDLYALFSFTNDGVTYENSVMVKVIDSGATITLDVNNEVELGKNALNMTIGGDFVYVACVGGRQKGGANVGSNGPETKICRVKKVNGVVVSEVAYVGLADLPSAPYYDFHGVAVGEDYVLILTLIYDANYATNWRVSRISASAFHSALNTPISAVPDNFLRDTGSMGYFWAVAYESSYKHFWVVRGGPILVYPYNPNLPGAESPVSFSMVDLYGQATAELTSIDLTIDKKAVPAASDAHALMRGYVDHEVAMGQHPSQAAFINELRKKLPPKAE